MSRPPRASLAAAISLLIGSQVQSAELAPSLAGQRLFERQCSVCHGIDGSGGRGPSLRRARLPHAPNDVALRTVIYEGIAPDMPDGWYLSEDDVANLGAYVRSLGALPAERVPGDAHRGASIYARSGCATCHVIAGEGHSYGPDLTGIGERRNAAFLKEAILDPARKKEKAQGGWTLENQSLPAFLVVEAFTNGGEKIRGIRVNEDSFTIQIRDSEDRFYSLRKADLTELRKLRGVTPMPSYRGVLAEAELQDLVAFLVVSEVRQ